MKEQWSVSENNTELRFMEEGLNHKKQKYIKNEYQTNCCLRCIPYLKLIFLLEVTLFLGCFMIFSFVVSPTNFFQAVENEAANDTLEKYPPYTPPIIESPSEIQESRQSTEVPAVYVKPEVIIDKINDFLEDKKFTKKDQYLMQNKVIIIDAANTVQTSTGSNNVRRNNIKRIYDVNRLLARLLSRNSAHDKEFTENSVPEILSTIEPIDEISTHEENESPRHIQFLKKLLNISKVKSTNDLLLEKLEGRNDFTEDADDLTLRGQENHALDESNEPESLGLNTAIISNIEKFVHAILVNLTKPLQDLKSSDLIKDAAQDDPSENNSFFDKTDKRVNTRLQLNFDMNPLYKSHESSDKSVKDSSKDFSISQQELPQEISEQFENVSSDDIDERNEEKMHDVTGSDMSMSVSTSGNQDWSPMQSAEEQHASEGIAEIIEDENESMQPTVQEFSSNVGEFQWFNVAPRFAELERKSISKSSEEHSSLHWDIYEENVDDVIPESQCEVTIKMGILRVKCPAIKFDEEWNFTSSEIPPTDANVPKSINFQTAFDVFLLSKCNGQLRIENISNRNSDKEATMSRDSVPEITDTIELQESTTSFTKCTKFSNGAFLDLPDVSFIDPSYSGDNGESNEFYNFPFYDSNEEEVSTVSSLTSEFSSDVVDSDKQNPFFDFSSKQQQKQWKINEEKTKRENQQDSISHNSEAFLKNLEHFYNLKKNLTFLLQNEMSDVMTQYLSNLSYRNNYQNNVCNIVRYMRTISQHPWREQYAILKKFLEHIENPDYPHSEDDYHRKKRMTDDLTCEHDEVSNTLEEDKKNVDLLENLKKIYQKMEILTLYIDRLQERYLLYNKLDDDYVSSEFPIQSKERESYHSRVIYEK